MTKSFIKKIFYFNKSQEQEIEKQTSIPDKSDIIEENKDKNERTKNNQISTDTEKEEQTKNRESTLTKYDEKSPFLESHSDKIPFSGKIIVTDNILEKKMKKFYLNLLLNKKR